MCMSRTLNHIRHYSFLHSFLFFSFCFVPVFQHRTYQCSHIVNAAFVAVAVIVVVILAFFVESFQRDWLTESLVLFCLCFLYVFFRSHFTSYVANLNTKKTRYCLLPSQNFNRICLMHCRCRRRSSPLFNSFLFLFSCYFSGSVAVVPFMLFFFIPALYTLLLLHACRRYV